MTAEFLSLNQLDYSGTEAVNTLCTNLSFVNPNIKKIMLTSCRPEEGKSFMSINLMRAMAGLGKRVILVDADLRRSVMESRYGISLMGERYGLSHYLAGMCSLEDILYTTDIQGALIVPSGPDVANPMSLLSSGYLPQLLDDLSGLCDTVLIDAPPIGSVIDAAVIARACDGMLFVVRSNTVTRAELLDARLQIEKTGCAILGTVLNQVATDSRSAKKYYYKAYYNHDRKDGSASTIPAPPKRKKRAAPTANKYQKRSDRAL